MIIKHNNYNYSEKTITELLIALETEGKIHFNKSDVPAYNIDRKNIFSRKVAWYWVVTIFAIITVISIFAIPETAYPLVYIRTILGAPYVLFLPGFSFIKALYPNNVPFKTSSEQLDTIERVSLSIGMSIALVSIVGLILNYTPWGVRLSPTALSLLALTIMFATIAILREHQQKLTPNKSA